ncbi:MAG TPA: tRNA guanosine(15) transglycosylase TgtA [Thermoplasmata archaeon]|nr:tRNA guanosine(15) transglycosylase TgtA [Thermoplasmata archaeon]
MVDFELLERDGLARLGRFTTPHGTIETPALLPVVHPDPERQPWSPTELRERLGVRAVITSAYITWRTPPLRAVAERDGIHGLLRFDGPVMTDSGAFQQHAYGSVEVGPEEILAFQGQIGSDIATVLDLFTEPETSHEEAQHALDVTEERLRTARAARSGLLAAPVQGGLYPDLRFRAATTASEVADLLAVGGVVPLFERYRFAELVRVVAAARPALTPAAPVHLFGTGHPMTFGLAALLGVDLFDSSAYHKFARRGQLMFPEGTVPLDSIREPICRCALCAAAPLSAVAQWPVREREAHLALHNLSVSLEEIGRIRQAIRDGTLWELVERRATSHPALRAGVDEAMAHPEIFWPAEPESRRAFREIRPESVGRPSVVRFQQRVVDFSATRRPARMLGRIALRPEFLGRVPTEDRAGVPIWWNAETPLGVVPLELTDLYPVGPYLGSGEFTDPPRHRAPSEIAGEVARIEGLNADLDQDWTAAWTDRQVRSLLEWQYGRALARSWPEGLAGERSRRTGRLRRILHDGEPMFVVGSDGVPRPTFRGGATLREAAPPGRHRVVVADDAVDFVRAGRSLFSRFVVAADPVLVPGSSALLVDRADTFLAVGRLLLAPHEMGRLRRGVAVWPTAHAKRPVPETEEEELPPELRIPRPDSEPLKGEGP